MSSSTNNTSSCVVTDFNRTAALVYSSTGGVAFLVCAAAIVQFLIMKLYKKVVYRLALYPVVSALIHAIVGAVQLTFVVGNRTIFDKMSGRPCVALGFFHEYTIMLKLMFTLWVTFHIFCYAVFYKNMKRLEIMYVITSLLLPLLISILPFTTNTYGLAGSWCWIRSESQECPGQQNIAGLVEQFALLYVPGVIALAMQSVAMVTIIVILCYRAKWNTLYDHGVMQTLVLKQMLPLAAYPITFCALFLPPFINRAYILHQQPPQGLLLTSAFCIQLWSFAAGLSLWIHICVVRKAQLKKWTNMRTQFNFHTPLLHDK